MTEETTSKLVLITVLRPSVLLSGVANQCRGLMLCFPRAWQMHWPAAGTACADNRISPAASTTGCSRFSAQIFQASTGILLFITTADSSLKFFKRLPLVSLKISTKGN